MNDLSVLVHIALLLVRPGVVVALAPTFGGKFVPTPTKIGLTVLIALGLLPSVTVPPLAGEVGLIGVIAREVAIGLALGMTMRALIAGAEFAGHLSGSQMGLSYSATVDPANGVRNTTVSALFGLLATLTLFGIDGHHQILRALASSYTGMPVGSGGVDPSLLTAVRETFALVFITGARLATPIIIVLLIVEVAIGFVSRVAPALTFMVIGYPLRMIVGLFVLGLVVAVVPTVIAGLSDRTISLALDAAMAFR